MDGDPFDLVGDTLDGQFRVEELVGEGDLSVVYRGHHIGVDATVAIKCLNLPATLDPALVRPLVESFREASRLHYRLARGNMNIAQSVASGQTIAPRTGTTVPYLVREWLEGESLASELARRRSEGKKGRSFDEAVALLDPAVDGMAYAHRHDVVHLSFHPSNLFLAKQDDARTLKVLDFGVARALNEIDVEMPDGSGTPAGLRVLFPSYAAPEQLDRTVGEVGAWTDVYAIALVLMEVLSDRVVMAGTETGALVDRALDERKRPTPQSHGLKLSRHVETVLARAVARTPGMRQKDAASLWSDLKSAARATGSRRSIPAMRAPSATITGVAPPAPPPVSGSVPAPAVASPAPALAAVSAPAPAPPQIITAKLPPPLPSAHVEPALSPLEKRVRPPPGLTPTFIAVTSSVGGLLLVALILLLATWPKPRRASAPPAPVAAPMLSRNAPPPAATASTPTATPTPQTRARFPAFAAQRALDGTAHEVGRCRRSDTWGVAKATVTFANDGSVDHVLIGPPFTGTPTGQCVADAMSTVQVPAFGGRPVVYITQFFVPR